MAGMAKLADAADLKSAGPKGLWGFDSPSRHQMRVSDRASKGEAAIGVLAAAPSARTRSGPPAGCRRYGGGYHTRHTLAAGFTMGWPCLQEKASAKSGMFTTTPL